MQFRRRRSITYRPITEADFDDVMRLSASHVNKHLLTCDEAAVRLACRDHRGAVAVDDTKTVVAVCLYKPVQLPAAEWRAIVRHAIYIYNLVVDTRCWGFGIGTRLGEVTVAYAFATTESEFPDTFPVVVAAAFEDSPLAQRAQQNAGMTCFPANNSEIECDPVLRVLDRWAFEEKRNLGADERPHTIQAFNARHLVVIASWMTVAYKRPVYDRHHGLEIRVQDPSDGRNGVRWNLRNLARGEVRAIGRLNIARLGDESVTLFRTKPWR